MPFFSNIQNPLTHQSHQRIGPCFTGVQLGEALARGCIYGLIAGRFFKGLNPYQAVLMASSARLSELVVNRISTNANLQLEGVEDMAGLGKALMDKRNRGTFIALIGFGLSTWFSPFAARAIDAGASVYAYYRSRICFVIACAVVGRFIDLQRTIAERAGVSQKAQEFGLLEWVDRPWSTGLSAARDALAECPQLPEMYAPEALEETPSLEDIFRDYNVDEEMLAKVGRYELSAEQSGGEYHKLLRNAAFYLKNVEDARKREYISDLCDVFNGCETRQTMGVYRVLLHMTANASTPEEKLRLDVTIRNQEVRQEVITRITTLFGSDASKAGGAVHSAIYFAEGTKEVGLLGADKEAHMLGSIEAARRNVRAMAEVNPLIRFDEATARVQLEADWQKKVAEFTGLNKEFWMRAFETRYIEMMIDWHGDAINADADQRILATQALIEHLKAVEQFQSQAGEKSQEKSLEAEEEIGSLQLLDAVGRLYNTKTTTASGLPVYQINREGVILLLKITGHLVEDGRLHTRLTNEQVMAELAAESD